MGTESQAEMPLGSEDIMGLPVPSWLSLFSLESATGMNGAELGCKRLAVI